MPCSLLFQEATSYVVLYDYALSIQGNSRLPNEESQRGGFLCASFIALRDPRVGRDRGGEPSRAGAKGDFRVLYEVSRRLACMLEL